MRDQRAELVLARECVQRVCIVRINRLCITAARIARKKLKCVGANREGDAARGRITLGIAQMAA
ncbi:hypothetical protein SDC9_145792 [bioreactor metagenome]|uniref:Uncharacterized protein n=1 Tax=bioreactor metagenome TaxID=1076179 RepID=A0A645E9C1_9ZZZZ